MPSSDSFSETNSNSGLGSRPPVGSSIGGSPVSGRSAGSNPTDDLSGASDTNGNSAGYKYTSDTNLNGSSSFDSTAGSYRVSGHQSLGNLTRDLLGDFEALLTEHLMLAKIELKNQAKAGITSLILLSIAGLVGMFTIAFALVALGFVLMTFTALAPWLCWTIVTIVCLILTGICGAIGVVKLKKASVLPPPHTKQTIKESVSWLKAETIGNR